MSVHTRRILKLSKTSHQLCTTGDLTPGRNSRRQRHPPALDDEELFIIEGSPAATGAQLRDNPEEREKCGKTAKKKKPSLTSLRNHRDVQTLSMNCNSGIIDHPVRVLHLRYFHSFLHCQTQAPVVVQQRVSQPVQEQHLCELNGLWHSLHCVPVSVKQLHHHSVEELKLRQAPPRTRRKPAGTELRGHRDVHNGLSHRRGASISIPPWPGGAVLLKQRSCFPPPQGLHGHDCKSITGSRRHFHQLFRQLRSPEQRALRDGVLGNDRGHFDNLLGNNRQ